MLSASRRFYNGHRPLAMRLPVQYVHILLRLWGGIGASTLVILVPLYAPAFAEDYHGTAKWIWVTSENCAMAEGGCDLYRKLTRACQVDGSPSLHIVSGRAFYAPIYYPDEPAPGGGLPATLEDVHPAASRRWDCLVKVERWPPRPKEAGTG